MYHGQYSFNQNQTIPIFISQTAYYFKEFFMKSVMCILVLALVISGCDDMKMDKKVEKQITLVQQQAVTEKDKKRPPVLFGMEVISKCLLADVTLEGEASILNLVTNYNATESCGIYP